LTPSTEIKDKDFEYWTKIKKEHNFRKIRLEYNIALIMLIYDHDMWLAAWLSGKGVGLLTGGLSLICV